MAELADALDLGSNALRCAGSIPVTRTIKKSALCSTHLCEQQSAFYFFVYVIICKDGWRLENG